MLNFNRSTQVACTRDRYHRMMAAVRQVSAYAPARLHLGFLDPNGSRGRRFCSVGLTLEGMGVSLTVERASAFSVSGPQAARVEAFARAMREKFNFPGDCRIVVHQAIPEHVGLGSGTQLAIAVGVALAALYRLDLPARAVATLYQRGQRSGIGVGAFEQGGFLIDGGKDAGADPPPIVSRLEFPAGWRVVLLLDSGVQGLHGESEIAAFQALPEFPESESAHLCRLMFTQALPGLVEQDLDKFGGAIGERPGVSATILRGAGRTVLEPSSCGSAGMAGEQRNCSSRAKFLGADRFRNRWRRGPSLRVGAQRAITLGRSGGLAVQGLQRPQSWRCGRTHSLGSCLRRQKYR